MSEHHVMSPGWTATTAFSSVKQLHKLGVRSEAKDPTNSVKARRTQSANLILSWCTDWLLKAGRLHVWHWPRMWRNGGVHRCHDDVVGTTSWVQRRLDDAVHEGLSVVVDDVQRLAGAHACHIITNMPHTQHWQTTITRLQTVTSSK